MTRCFLVLQLGVQLEKVAKVTHMLVVSLDSDTSIMLQGHGSLQEAELITRFIQNLRGNGVVLLQTWHQFVHHKASSTDDQNVIDMDENNATAISILENAWVRLVLGHVKLCLQMTSYGLVPQEASITLTWQHLSQIVILYLCEGRF